MRDFPIIIYNIIRESYHTVHLSSFSLSLVSRAPPVIALVINRRHRGRKLEYTSDTVLVILQLARVSLFIFSMKINCALPRLNLRNPTNWPITDLALDFYELFSSLASEVSLNAIYVKSRLGTIR